MRIKILIAVLFFCCLRSSAQTRPADTAEPNYKDSANKYWKIGMLYMDSAVKAHDMGNLLHFRYYARKAEEANIKSAKYVEKQ